MKPYIYRAGLFIALALALASFTGCSSLARGVQHQSPTKDTLGINSIPQGAHVTLSDGQTALTPATFNVRRNIPNLSASVQLEGYVSQKIPFKWEIGAAGYVGYGLDLAAMIVCPPAGLLGAGTDKWISGAPYQLETNSVNVVLVPLSDQPTPQDIERGIVETVQQLRTPLRYPTLINPNWIQNQQR